MTAPRQDDLRTAIAGRLRQHGIGGDLDALRRDQSLRPETYAATPGAVARETVNPPHLPHITLAEAGKAPEGSTTAGADLVVGDMLGAGGMGVVQTAFQQSLDRDVAIKRAHADGERNVHAALVREARVTARVEGPHVVPVHALGQHASGAVLLMKRIEGTSWRTLLLEPDHEAWGPLRARWPEPLEAHVAILSSLCDALELAHARAVVHLDIKPDNVLVGPFGEVYLVDWGIARRLDGSTEPMDAILGTPGFMAPEMVLSPDALDARTDVYLLGATLHQVLTGSPPHRGETLLETLWCAAENATATYEDSVPDDLAALALAAMASDPAARPQTVASFRHALREHERHRTAAAAARDAADLLARVAPAGQVPLDSEEGGRLLVEARLGLVSALKTCAESRPAQRGLRACLERAIEREIVLRAPAAARALTSQLADAPPALLARIADVESEIAAGDEARVRLERSRREADSSPGFRIGMSSVAAGTLAMVLTHGYFGLRELGSGQASPIAPILLVELVPVLGVTTAQIALRRRLWTTGMVGRLSRLQLVLIWMTVASDALVWRRGGDARDALAQILVVLGAAFAVAAVGLVRELALSSAVVLTYAWIATVVVGAPSLLRAAAVASFAFVTGLVMRRHARISRTEPPTST